MKAPICACDIADPVRGNDSPSGSVNGGSRHLAFCRLWFKLRMIQPACRLAQRPLNEPGRTPGPSAARRLALRHRQSLCGVDLRSLFPVSDPRTYATGKEVDAAVIHLRAYHFGSGNA